MNKGLEALENVEYALKLFYKEDYKITKYVKEIATIEKELKDKEKYFKAVDFLLENGLVDLGYDKEEGSYYINLNCGKILISDEEYKLWKGILDNE